MLGIACGNPGSTDNRAAPVAADPSAAPVRLVELPSFQGRIGEFMKSAVLEQDLLIAKTFVLDIEGRMGDSGDLYRQYTAPLLRELVNAEILPEVRAAPGAVAAVEVFAPIPSVSRTKNARLDIYLRTLGNAYDVTRGTLYPVPLTSGRSVGGINYALPIQDLSGAREVPADEWRAVFGAPASAGAGESRDYADGSRHQPKLYRLKDGARLMRDLPPELNARRKLVLTIERVNREMLEAIQSTIAQRYPFTGRARGPNDRGQWHLELEIPERFTQSVSAAIDVIEALVFSVIPVNTPLICVDNPKRRLALIGRGLRFVREYKETRVGVPLWIVPEAVLERLDEARAKNFSLKTVARVARGPGPLVVVQFNRDGSERQRETLPDNALLPLLQYLRDRVPPGYGPRELKGFCVDTVKLRCVEAFLFERELKRLHAVAGVADDGGPEVTFDLATKRLYVGDLQIFANVVAVKTNSGEVVWDLSPMAGSWYPPNLATLTWIPRLNGAVFELESFTFERRESKLAGPDGNAPPPGLEGVSHVVRRRVALRALTLENIFLAAVDEQVRLGRDAEKRGGLGPAARINKELGATAGMPLLASYRRALTAKLAELARGGAPADRPPEAGPPTQDPPGANAPQTGP